MKRLTPAMVDGLGASAPKYGRDGVVEIVHLGVGAFHRGHQVAYIDRYLDQGHAGWRIVGASLRGNAVARQLNPQAGLYTIVEQDGKSRTTRVVRALKNVIVAPETPELLVKAIADAAIKIITLTITEKGYCLTPSGEGLNKADLAVVSDMRGDSIPLTAPGFIASGLERRFAAGAPPVTILSCDNISANGERTRQAVLAMLEARQSACIDWVRNSCTFPSSMVDRIVPATTREDIDTLHADCGYVDLGMVKTEPFTQWVVEDNFCSGRPALEVVGVQFTEDVSAWEEVKLRLLNAAHSALAYLGYLAGHEYVHTAISAPGYEAFVDSLWDETEVTLTPSKDIDVPAYRAALLTRFRNSALRHRTFQISADGSQKLPQRFLNTIRDRRAMGLESPALTLAVAGWILWQRGIDGKGNQLTVIDPLADEMRDLVERAGDDAVRLADEFCNCAPVFGHDFANDTAFAEGLSNALETLFTFGAGDAVAAFSRHSVSEVDGGKETFARSRRDRKCPSA